MFGHNGGFLFPKRDKRLIELDKLDDELAEAIIRSDSLTYLESVLREDEESDRVLVLQQLAKENIRIHEIRHEQIQLMNGYREHITAQRGSTDEL